MKYSLATVAAVAALASATDVTNLPQCSIGCFAQAAGPTGCQLLDLDCQCKPANQNLIRGSVTPCILQSCQTQEELLQAVQVSYEICQERGGAVGGLYTVSGIPESDLSALSTAFPQAIGGPSGGMATASAVPTMKASSSMAVPVYTSAAATSKASVPAYYPPASTPAGTPAGTYPPVATYTGAAAQAGVAVGALAAAAVALL